MPRVAVLLPARNAAATVRAAAASILRQTERDLALVCVDDGSSDGTGEVLSRFAERDGRVRVVAGPGQGIARALNHGLGACDAEVVARMDADDVAHPERLALQLEALSRDPSLAAVGSRVRLFPRSAVRAGMIRYAAWLNGLVAPDLVLRDLLVESPLVHPAAAVRRGALEAAGGWRDGPFPEDYDLWLRLTERGGRLSNVDRRLLDWRESAGRLTRTDPRYELARHMDLKAAFLARGPLAGHGEVAIWGAGETGRAFADALAPHRIAPALFVDVDPRKIGRTVRGAPVVGVGDVGRARGLPLLVAVGAAGARDLIRAELGRAGFVEVRDFRCVA
ncbi:MAG TPA: glycosyltransferase [Anaeromyxobacteraceae bacterium]|nr:glycosyltransferase [Anaeromyxobacteraceae bacterium]